jgi:hypothetical protein
MDDRLQRARAGFEMVLALYEFGEDTLRQKLRRNHPEASDERIDAWVAEWQERRPGAENGDGEGYVVPWPRCT